LNHTTAVLPLRRARSEKILFICIQQLMKPDAFNQMKIL